MASNSRSSTEGPPERLPRGPHKLARDEVAANQRARLLVAMIEAVGEKGYAGTAVADVIKRAGVSRKAFYEHFANKRDCFLAAFDAVAAAGKHRLSLAYREGDGWPAAIEAGIRSFFDAALDNPAAARLGLIEVGALGAEGIERRERSLEHYERFVQDALEQAPESGVLPPIIIKAVLGGVNGVLFRRLQSGRGSELPGLVPDLGRWATAYYPAPESLLAHHARPHSDRSSASPPLVAGRLPGSLSPQTLASGRRGLPRGDNNVSRSFVIHSQRERVLDAVTRLSAEKGYIALTVEEIAGEAAVSLEAFYTHFESKQDAFLVAYELGHLKSVAIAERAFNGQQDWRIGVREALRALLDLLAGEPAFARLSLVEALIASPQSSSRQIDGVRAYSQMLLPGMDEPPAESRPPAVTLEAITGAVVELLYHYAVQGRTSELPELLVDVTYIALAPFIGAEQAMAIALEG